MANLEQYRAVLEDLEKQKNEFLFKAREIDVAISSLKKLMPEGPIAPSPHVESILPVVEPGKYVGISVRWAILCLLTEDAIAPMATGEIAQMLSEGGITSSSRNFASNVSAVLSDMYRQRHEVDQIDGKWVITEAGKSAWIHISSTRNLQRSSTASERQPLQ